MSTTITVHVTKDVLEQTKYCKTQLVTHRDGLTGQNCAIGYCIHNLFPNSWVGEEKITLYKEPLFFSDGGWLGNVPWLHIPLPEEATRFIRLFDKKMSEDRVKMGGLSFEIEIPDEALSTIDISEVHRILKESKTLSLVR